MIEVKTAHSPNLEGTEPSRTLQQRLVDRIEELASDTKLYGVYFTSVGVGEVINAIKEEFAASDEKPLLDALNQYHLSWCDGCGMMGDWEWKPMARFLMEKGVTR